MVLSVLIAFGVVTGASEGLKASQSKARREEHRSRKNNLIVNVPKSSEYSLTLEGRRVVLSGEKLYIDTGRDNEVPFGHPFEGYYLAYPGTQHAGLVTTISDEAPIMNWVYMDALTYEIKFGTRQWAEGNLTGPFDCTRQDRRMTLAGYEGFVAVREGAFWALYFDWDGDRLKAKVPEGTPVVDVDLLRKEMRTRKPPREQLKQPENGQAEGRNQGQDGEQQQQAGQAQTQQQEGGQQPDAQNQPAQPELQPNAQ